MKKSGRVYCRAKRAGAGRRSRSRLAAAHTDAGICAANVCYQSARQAADVVSATFTLIEIDIGTIGADAMSIALHCHLSITVELKQTTF